MVELIIGFAPFFLALLAGAFIFALFHTYSLQKMVSDALSKSELRMQAKESSRLTYEETKAYLLANGTSFHFGEWMTPAVYFALRIGLAVVGFAIGIIGKGPAMGILTGVIGYAAVPFYISRSNVDDNKKMTDSVAILYNTLQIQVESGVEVSVALAKAKESIPAGRLRKGLDEYARQLASTSDFEASISDFNSKFSNEFIDSLCVILTQAKKTGRAADLMRDMSTQISQMQNAMLLEKKGALERKTTFIMLLLLIFGLGVVIYGMVSMMGGAITGLS